MKAFRFIACAFLGAVSPAALQAQEDIVTQVEGKIIVRAVNAPLSHILEELTQVTSVAFVISPQIAHDPLTLELAVGSADEAVHGVLSRYDAYCLYVASENGAGRLQAAWVYPKGYGKRIRPVPPEDWASTAEMEKALLDSDPAVRARAYETVIKRKRGESKDLVTRAVKNEPVESVRLRIFYAAMENGVRLPPELVQSLAISDPSEQMRVMALEVLEKNDTVRGLLNSALADPSLLVQTKAREMLEDLDAAPVDRSDK